MRSNTTGGDGGCKSCQAAKVERLAEEFGSILSENASDIIGSVLSEQVDLASLIAMFKPMLEKLMKKFGVDSSDIFDMAESYLGEGTLQNLMEQGYKETPIYEEEDDDWFWIIIIVIILGVIYYVYQRRRKKKHQYRNPNRPGGGGGHPGGGGNPDDIPVEDLPDFPGDVTSLPPGPGFA